MTPSLSYPPSSRPATMGVNGMVASAHPLATLAGLSTLRAGGNAFDAVVATASTLNVVEPYMSGIGGIGAALVHVASEGRVRALDFSGRAPLAAEPSVFSNKTKDNGILAAMVPGNLAGWLTIHEAYGSMELARLLAPAIAYAEDGFPVSHFNSKVFREMAPLLLGFPASAGIILGSGGEAPAPGARLCMPQLAATLRRVVKGGLDEFHRGELAREIVEGNAKLGGLYTEEDLATYETRWLEPISVTYKGYEVFTTPPNSSGFQILQTLKLLETFDDTDRMFQDPCSLHMFMEAVKLCVTDRMTYAGDPDYVSIPLDALLSEGYAAQQAARISRDAPAIVAGERYAQERPAGALKPGSPAAFDGGMTTHFAVADRDGNVVTVTQTLGGGFGSGAAVGGTGIFLNNMASYFELDETSPNRIGPGKRVDFVIAPTQTFRDGQFHLSMGTPGSWGILQTTPQFLTNVLDYGMTVQQAIEAPRFRYFGGLRVQMEERFPLHVRRALEARGHQIEVVEAWSTSVGGAQAIQFDPGEGTFQGGADPRRDGYALGF